jgi:ABC-type multidrug transport system ATPase subunit
MSLEMKLDTRVKMLVDGEKRKVSIGMSIIGKSDKVLILDEPTASLDLVSQEQLWVLLH